MTFEGHLEIQTHTIPAASEWIPRFSGWVFVRIARGVGYWRSPNQNTDFKASDVVIVYPNNATRFLASQLGDVSLLWFGIDFERLSGILNLSEKRYLESALSRIQPHGRIIPGTHPVAERFAKAAASSERGTLVHRLELLQLFAESFGKELPFHSPSNESPGAATTKQRLKQLIEKFPEAELQNRSVSELAKLLNCSQRHLSRLFREEFGISLRSKQTELRLLKARQLLSDPTAKVINVAMDSGYRHLGLFNEMFKKRFGMTPSQWRAANGKERKPARKALRAMAVLFLMLGGAGTDLTAAPAAPASTNAVAGFAVDGYEVQGNTLLSQKSLENIFKDYVGESVSLNTVKKAMAELQLAYRGRGFYTVNIVLPQQQLTNRYVKVRVIEGKLADVAVVNNKHYSTNNVLRLFPSLTRNAVLNSRVFQAELDEANKNRDRQIYPEVQPGPEPNTSALVLKVKDRFPLHGKFEVNTHNTPNTPAFRMNASAVYDNLWQIDHSIGVQYGFTPDEMKEDAILPDKFYDAPLIANYSAFYRFPIGRTESISERINADPGSFGYDEVSRRFRLPPPSGRTEMNVFASRSTSDTGVQYTPEETVVESALLTIRSQDTGRDQTVNEGFGARLSVPLDPMGGVESVFSTGFDWKYYTLTSGNTNNFNLRIVSFTSTGETNIIFRNISSPQPIRNDVLSYLPLSARWDGFRRDKTGVFSLGVGVSANFLLGPFSDEADFEKVAGSTESSGRYVTATASLSREQKIYKDWALLMRGDGQWANEPLIGNEQYGVGGVNGVRGYHEGEQYGDRGFRFILEPKTPVMNLGMVDGRWPMRARASIFMDYAELFLIEPNGRDGKSILWGTGATFNASIGNTWDFRMVLGYPLKRTVNTPEGDVRVSLALGAQF